MPIAAASCVTGVAILVSGVNLAGCRVSGGPAGVRVFAPGCAVGTAQVLVPKKFGKTAGDLVGLADGAKNIYDIAPCGGRQMMTPSTRLRTTSMGSF